MGTSSVSDRWSARSAAETDFQTWRLGLNSKLGWNDTESKAPGASASNANWELHGQTTYIQQGYPPFRAPYSRPDDNIGMAGAVNALSADHRDFTAAGGLGILIGDGKLSYRPEQIFEIYYAYAVTKVLALTFDYQFIANPAYNADRGPVSILSWRVHAEF
jgi:carbohydrate-selective porin OprB